MSPRRFHLSAELLKRCAGIRAIPWPTWRSKSCSLSSPAFRPAQAGAADVQHRADAPQRVAGVGLLHSSDVPSIGGWRFSAPSRNLSCQSSISATVIPCWRPAGHRAGRDQYLRLGRTFRATSAGKTSSAVMIRTGRPFRSTPGSRPLSCPAAARTVEQV